MSFQNSVVRSARTLVLHSHAYARVCVCAYFSVYPRAFVLTGLEGALARPRALQATCTYRGITANLQPSNSLASRTRARTRRARPGNGLPLSLISVVTRQIRPSRDLHYDEFFPAAPREPLEYLIRAYGWTGDSNFMHVRGADSTVNGGGFAIVLKIDEVSTSVTSA